MNALKKTLYDNYKAAAEKVIPDLTNNKFTQTGMLTKDEFKVACNHLMKIDSTWEWNVTDICLQKRNILCHVMKIEEDYNASETNEFDMSIYDFTEDDIDNTDTTITNTSGVINTTSETISKTKTIEIEMEDANDSDSDDDGLAELEDNTLISSDEATIQTSQQAVDSAGHYYDVYITYDQYYRTPRIWFIGKKVDGTLLSSEDTYTDFMAEYLKVSLTMELNPVLHMQCVSVHPCKHAYAMQRMIAYDMEKKDESEINIEDYLVYFMKFASSVIPQLEFDCTSL
jgi:ubiquitin-like-conjugating enzyme ATG3